jgi:hypothetical protein
MKKLKYNRKKSLIYLIILLIILVIFLVILLFVLNQNRLLKTNLDINLPKPISIVKVAETHSWMYNDRYVILRYDSQSIEKIKNELTWINASVMRNDNKIDNFLAFLKINPDLPKNEITQIDKYYPNYSSGSLYFEKNNIDPNDNEGDEIILVLDPINNNLYVFESYL